MRSAFSPCSSSSAVSATSPVMMARPAPRYSKTLMGSTVLLNCSRGAALGGMTSTSAACRACASLPPVT